MKNSLKFEHEMKGKFHQKYHLLLVSNRLKEFEQKLFFISVFKFFTLFRQTIDSELFLSRLVSDPIRTYSQTTNSSMGFKFRLHKIRNISGYKNFGHASSIFNLCSTLTITRPTAMPHQEFVGLTQEERRALPHSNDMKIIHELKVGFWQSKFKVGDHGAIHDLPYTIKDNGGTKTEKTDDNALKMMRSIVDMPNRDNVKWIEDGTSQGGTDR
jgi:hypothetical protein